VFEKLLKKGYTKAAKHGKADWDEILKTLQSDGNIHTTTKIWEDYVKKAVARVRCKNWLHQQFEKDHTCLRVYRNGRYFWTFNATLVEKFFSKK